MNSKPYKVLVLCTVFLVAFSLLAFAGGQKPAPAPHPSAPPPSHPAAPPPHPAAPPSHPAGQNNAQHGGAPNNANHNGNQNAPHGTNGTNSNNHSNNGGGNNANKGGNNNANAKNGANTNKGGNNTGGGNNANKGGNNNANAKNGAATNKGGNNASNNNAKGGNQANGGKNGHPGANTSAHETHTPNGAKAGNGNAMASRRGPPVHTREITAHNGAKVQASYRGGHVRTIQAHNMRIEHSSRGERRIVAEHNGRRVVCVAGRRGYMERPYFNRGGRAYVQRTYYYGGRPYAYAYRTYYYGGRPYYGYAPAYYYQPAYYGWAYQPWPQPAYYQWGYYNQPWYGYYNPYYQPAPSYPSGSSWLSDYITSENLKAAFEATHGAQSVLPDSLRFAQPATDWLSAKDFDLGAEGRLGGGTQAASKSAQPALTPEVKQELADQIKQEIEDEKAASDGSAATTAAGKDEPPPAMDPKHRIFVVSSGIDVTAGDKECHLSPGDIIKRTGDSADDDNNVAVLVKASQKDDCAAGTETAVDAGDLQEMHNNLRETMDRGLKELADNSGKNGLPKAPDTTTKAGEVPAPTADSNVDSELQQAQKDADQTEADVPKDDAGGSN